MAQKKPEPLPKPPLALNIGVTGHRPDSLQDTKPDVLSAKITGTLKLIANKVAELAGTTGACALYNDAKPVLRLLSSLAEGADRIAAHCALAEGYTLQCLLPFEREVYAGDFTDPASIEAYHNLLKSADRVLQLDGVTNKKRLAYRQAGQFVLHHADIMLAVWDGDEDETSAGTAGLVAETQRQGLPLIWINAAAPHEVKYWNRQAEEDKWTDFDADWLSTVLESVLLPRKRQKKKHHWFDVLKQCCPEIRKDTYKDFYHQAEPRRTLRGTAYRAFFAFYGKHSLRFFGNSYRQDAESQWAVIAEAARHLPKGSRSGDTLEKLIHQHYVRADSLASYYADHYRGTFVLTFFLGACAVLFAALGAHLEGLPEYFLIFSYAELITIGIMIILFAQGYIRQTHQHWLDFRLLAERLRQQAFMLPIGTTSRWALPNYEGCDDSSHAWIDLFMRAVSRAEGIPHAWFGRDYRTGYGLYLADVLKDQAGYHERNDERNDNIAKFLEWGCELFLALVIVAGIMHICWHNQTIIALGWLTVPATALPAFSAAFAAILSQGEFERIALRSKGMAKELRNIVKKLKKRSQSPSAEELNKLVNDASDIMSSELSDWRVIFRNKNLKPN